MDELYVSRMKFGYHPAHRFFFEIGNGTEESNVRRMKADCPSFDVCMSWAKYDKNVSVYLSDSEFQFQTDNGDLVGGNGEPLLCRIDDGVFFSIQAVMIMFYGDPLLKRINEIFGRVLEAGLYKFWLSWLMNLYNIKHQKIAIVNPLDEYWSFSLYHMQPAFYLLLIGLCLSVFCFVFELLCYRLLNKRR
jgi:hypothetical protein